METIKKYESPGKILCLRGLDKCDLTLLGSMTREFERIDIRSLSPQSAREYTILELADAVKSVRLTFCDGRPKDSYHRVHCDPIRGLIARLDCFVSDIKGLNLSSFKET